MGGSSEPDEADIEHALLEALALEVRATELPAAQRERMRERIMARLQDAAPEGTSTTRASRTKWIDVCSGVQMLLLQRDEQLGRQTILLKMQPGGALPRHRHTQDEELLVLEGECSIGTHQLHAGDFHAARAGSWHERTTTTTGVLAMLRGEYPPPIAAR